MAFAESRSRRAGRLIAVGLFVILIAVSEAATQIPTGQLQRDYDDGLFEMAAERAKSQIDRESHAPSSVTPALLAAGSLIMLERYDEARQLLDTAKLIADRTSGFSTFANSKVLFGYSALERSRREFRAAIDLAQKARLASPNDPRIEAEYYFSIGRILYSMGHDVSAGIWLEKAEKLVGPTGDVELKIDINRYLSLASTSRFHYAETIAHNEKRIKLSERSRFRYKHQLALYELGNILNASGRKRSGAKSLEKALNLSLSAKNFNFAKTILTPLLLNALYDGRMETAATYLKQLELIDSRISFTFEIVLGRAVIAAFKGQKDVAERNFAELAKQREYSAHMVPYWKATIAEKNKDWEELMKQSMLLLKLAEENNFRDELPGVYLRIAKAYLGEGDTEKAGQFAKLTISIVEESRRSGDASFSFSMLDTYHSAYRLLAELRAANRVSSFELVDFIKARVLKDRIEDSFLRSRSKISPEARTRIGGLSEKFVEGVIPADELKIAENEIGKETASIDAPAAFAEQLKGISALDGTAIVSFLFTGSGEKLLAHVWTGEGPLRIVNLPISELEAKAIGDETVRKIRNFVFFKKDGKEIHDRLLAPLGIDAEKIIIIPDKSLWRIPFHALSEDGSTYLIEKKRVSYAPSVATLLASLSLPAASRKSIGVFANSLYRDRQLKYVDGEAKSIARSFGASPMLNANAADFLKESGDADILHFSMHAEVDPEEPLNSYLAFRPGANHDGRVTVEDLLRVRLKKNSLVFLASCDTSNVVNGEGLVSIAWAMLGSGSTSVISAQWEANDRSTAVFGDLFYGRLREGRSVAEAMQDASVGMIRNKSAGFHEPYYWAAFNLLGDFR